MPLNRYEIRNEYSLADAELYRGADKDDPEALLEGVAMAGLVGVLRQLGDLAEFAAETFHNLHEEVMSTAARGHSLMVRVQQLETEVPSIEKAFFSQTDHSSFLYNDGVDWRSNLQMDENLITRGDMPRFIMDSYEESRPPPRLFLLDKFDIAGAGACLKRYTDPSIFKAEVSGMTSTDVQREMKILKPKKKVSQWRDGQTVEFLQTSHTKLHQLLSEEHVELGVSNTARRVKLKRKLNGFPFNSKTGKSYMEKLLMSPMPDDTSLVKVNSPAILMAGRSDQSRLEVPEVRSVSPDRGNSWRKRSPPSPDREEMVLNRSAYAPTGDLADDKISTVPDLYYSFASKGFSRSTSDKMSGEKVIAVDAESSREDRTAGYESDSITSEVENFVDAPLTMESDTDTEPKLRMKNDFISPIVNGPQQLSGVCEEHINYRSSDSLSIGGSMISDEGNNSSRKEISSFASHSRSTSAENPHQERYGEGFPSTDSPGTEIAGALPHSTNQYASDFGQVTSRLASDESMSSSVHSDSAGVVTKYMLREPGTDERACTSSGNEHVTNLVRDTSYHHPTVSDFKLPRGNGLARASAGEHLNNEPNAERISSIYTAHGNFPTTKSSITMPLDSRDGEKSNHKDGNRVEDTNSRLNMPNVRSRRTIGTRKLSPSKYPIAGIPADRFPKLLVNNPADHPDMAHNRNNLTPMVPQKKSIRDSNISFDAPNHVSGMPVPSPGKKLKGISWSNVRTADAEVNHLDTSTGNQIRSNNFVSPHLSISVNCLQNGHGADEEIIPEQQTLVHENFALESSKSYAVLELSGKETVDVPSNNSEALESSCHVLEKIDKCVGWPDQFDTDGRSMCKSSSGKKITEFSDSAPKSPNEACVQLDGSDSDREKSLAIDMAYTELSDSQDVVDNVHTEVAIEQLEEHVHCPEHSGVDELECDKSHLVHANTAAEDSETVLGNCSNIEYPKSEVYGTVHNSPHDLEVANDLQFVHATTDQSIGDQTGMGSEYVCCEQSHLEYHVSDVMILPADCGTEQSKAHEKSMLQPNQLVQELLHSGKLISELSMLPIHHQQMEDCVDDKGDDYASELSLVDHPNSISVSEPQIQNDMDASAYHKETVDPILTPYGPSLGKNPIIPPDQPALPPLPPMQWRIGRLQHASSSSQVELKSKELSSQLVSTSTPLQWRTGKLPHASSTMEDDVKKLMELSPQLIPSSLSASTYGFPSTSLTVSADVASPSPLILPTDDVSSSVEDSQHTVARIASEERVENYGASTESKNDHDVGDLQPIISDQKQLVIPSAEGESTFTAEEELSHGSHTEKLALTFASIVNDDTGLDKSQPSDVTDQVNPQVHKVNERDSLSEQIGTKDTPEPIDHQMVKSKQLQFVLPTPRSEVSALAEEDGAPTHSLTGELAEPCATLEVATVLNNVSDVKEPDWPQVQKVDERDLLSEQVGMEHMHKEADHLAVIESKQRMFVMPVSESDTLPPDEEIEVPHGSHSGNDTLMEDVAGCGKSKHSEVKDQVRPPVQEVDGTDSVSEQTRTKDMEPSDVQHPMQINPQQLVLPTPESESVPPADENRAAHGSHTVKQRFPHNPLVEDISILDKSKLRKVTDRVKSQVQRVDEKDSLLEQIRTKSFNLRRAATSRPSIPGPQTNIKVAAILEKANAIRQAMAGSDEDDDDSWSDS